MRRYDRTLTVAQRRTLRALASLTKELRYTPSVRDIGEHLGHAGSTVSSSLDILHEKGMIDRTPGIARSLRITRAGRQALGMDPNDGD